MRSRTQKNFGRAICPNGLGVLAVLAGTLVLAACQTDGTSTPVVSLEEAKQITASFEGASFVPPPKTIYDITAILDEQKLADPDAAAKARAEAAEEPPPDVRGVALAKFYWQRGWAASKIGDVKRQIADLKEAERLSKDADTKTRHSILWDLGIAETYTGNFSDAIRHREEALAKVTEENRGALITRGAILASLYASSGDLDAADRLLAKSKRVYDEARSWKAWTKWGSSWTRGIHWGTGRIQLYKGRYAEAEHEFRLALKAILQVLKKNVVGKKYAAGAPPG